MLSIEFTSVWELNTLIHLKKNYLLQSITVDFIPYLIEFDFKMTTKKYFIPIHRF